MKRTLKKLTALLLSILLVTGTLTELAPATLAAGGGTAAPMAASPTDPNDPNAGRPRLYVDFLGDNQQYKAVSGETSTPGSLLTPGDVNQSRVTNNNGTNTWEGYTGDDVTNNPDTVFWVGVGIDRMNVLDLFKQEDEQGKKQGVYSLELGFYYDSDYIEPYTGGGGYKAAIEAANITNYSHRWGENYEILEAETGLAPQTDLVTQESVPSPTFGEIMGNATWKMTYISLEKKPSENAKGNRFHDLYNGTDAATKYLLLIPFKLKKYDFDKKLCLRLARNASHLSIGGGPDGDEPYAAWERVTTRHENRELKLMTGFMGDLNIFTGERAPENNYRADLVVENGGGGGNHATLKVTNDPSPNPAQTTDGGSITGLTSGTGMTVDVTCATGYKVKVEVKLTGGGSTLIDHTMVTDKKTYTFLMPEGSVTVRVVFEPDTSVTDFWAYLEETAAPKTAWGTDVEGNGTKIHITQTTPATVDKATPPAGERLLPGAPARKDVDITIETKVHPDYYAEVELYSFATNANLPPKTIETGKGITADGTTNKITMPAGGILTLQMPQSDISVKVTYLPATAYRAELEVYHALGSGVLDRNVAQLSVPVYTDAGMATWPSYSGVVYHRESPEQHDAVKPFRVLSRVDASAAAGSGALGGDRAAKSWTELLALVAAATDANFFKGKLNAYDLRRLPMPGKPDGLRKDAAGDFYTDGNITVLFDRLYALRGQGGTTALTEAQVQVYLAEWDAGIYNPTVKTASDAGPILAGYTWFVPSKDSAPPTAPDYTATPVTRGNYLEIRAGRQAELLLEADSAYKVASIILRDPTNAHADAVLTAPAAGYQNVYTFAMPAYRCKVLVTYVERGAHRLDLKLSDADKLADNKVKVTAFTPNSPEVHAKAETLEANGAEITAGDSVMKSAASVLDGSTVTVRVEKKTGYKVGAVVRTGSGTVSTSLPIGTTDLATGTEFTFTMPAEDAVVEITYTKDTPRYTATILVVGAGGSGVWEDPAGSGTGSSATKSNVAPGDALKGLVTVAPGWYIRSVEAYTDAAAYPYTLSGNGYNNGLGGRVTADAIMPNADFTVKVTLAQGIPPVEPELPLSIRVDDPDNMAPLADNWASVTAPISLGPVGKAKTSTWATGYAKAGDLVTVKLSPAAGYHVEDVRILPASLGAAVEWVDTTTVRFVMPAGSATAAVRFAKGDKTKAWFMNLAKTEPAGETSANNKVDKFHSQTILDAGQAGGWYTVPMTPSLPTFQKVPTEATAEGAARAGEKVILDLKVAVGWHIHSLTITVGGVRLPYYNLPADGGYSGGTAQPYFIMPNGEVYVTVNYRKAAPPTVRDRQIELAVSDPDNVTPYVDNWASATIAGSSMGSIDAVGRRKTLMRETAYAKPGDTVTIEYHADDDFALALIAVTPSGFVVPVYLGNGKASFTMPDADLTVEVRFKKGTAREYTADLILRPPAGIPVADVGEGSFGATLTPAIYSITAAPGNKIDVALLAKDGYYIKKIEVTPAALGVGASLSGSFGRQSSDFIMPGADVRVNVFFEKLWPNEVKYDLTLTVYDADQSGGEAHFGSIAGVPVTGTDADPVRWNTPPKTLTAAALDRDRVFVAINPEQPGHTAKREDITVTDASGRHIPWSYAPGGIVFTMPPSHVKIEVRFTAGTANPHTATLHLVKKTGTADGAAVLSGGGGSTNADNGTIANIPTGATMTVTGTPGASTKLTGAYAVSASGRHLIVPIKQATDGSVVTADFAMPDENADVYVVFDDTIPGANDQSGVLMVDGPSGSGYAAMHTSEVSTGQVNPGQTGLMLAPRDKVVTVDITTAANVQLAVLRVTDKDGNDVPYAWTAGGQRQLAYKMPLGGATVYVELEKTDPAKDYTAQVVVNNATAAGNNAYLRKNDTDPSPGPKLIGGLKAGDKVCLDVVVQPGYKVDAIFVVPAKYGIAPTLAFKPTKHEQTTSFTMPADDVVIYVRFAEDGRERKPVTLKVEDPSGVVDGNKAYIESEATPQQGPVRGGGQATVRAATPTVDEPGEWVSVEYFWESGHSVASVTVLEDNDPAKPVPFTQVDINHIRFPMVKNPVTVTVTYQNTPARPTFAAVLHVVNLSDPDSVGNSWGKLTWESKTTTSIFAAATPGNSATIQVPAGETVNLDAFADTDVYIHAAYVLYRAGGQMIQCNLAGFTGNQSTNFQMHPGQNDVYVYYTKKMPTATEYAAVLMLDGPNDAAGSKATIYNGKSPDPDKAEVGLGEHGYVTETAGKTIKVTIDPKTGYTVEYVLITPLGITDAVGVPIMPVWTGKDEFTFEMPAQNIAARVVLKKGAKEYKATLHYAMDDGSPLTEHDWASLSFLKGGVAETWKDFSPHPVPEGTEVTLGVAMGQPVVRAAYVLKGGELVPLGEALEGKGSVDSDPLKLDASAKFTMPGGDVDVYVWFTKNPPTGSWRTAILTVTDEDADGAKNTGKNSADIESTDNTPAVEVKSTGVPGHKYLTVKEGETVTVTVGTPAVGFEFDQATITHSNGGSAPPLAGTGTAPDTYTYSVGAFNSAVAVHFKARTADKNNLTVVIIDHDNPGDGTATNRVRVTPGVLSMLNLKSTTSAGAKQIIKDVPANTPVSFAVDPASGYLVTAALSTGTLSMDGSSGSFAMPSTEATLTVTFRRDYPAAYVAAVNQSYAVGSTVDMGNTTEIVNKYIPTRPKGTNWTEAEQDDAIIVNVTVADGYHAVVTARDDLGQAVSLSVGGGTPADRIVLATNGTVGFPMPAGTNVRVSVIFTQKTGSENHNLTLRLVGHGGIADNKAALTGGAVPITLSGAVAPSGADVVSSAVTAQLGAALELSADRGSDYVFEKATITVGGVETELNLNEYGANGMALLFMPDTDAMVTVYYKYKKTYTATLQIAGAQDADKAEMTNGTATVTATVSDPEKQITDLEDGAVLTTAAAPDPNRVLVGVVYTTDNTGARNVPADGKITIDKEDVTVTAVFRGQTDKYHIAKVTLDPDSVTGVAENTVSIEDKTAVPALPAGPFWTAANEGDKVVVTIGLKEGYQAVITSAVKDGPPPIPIYINRTRFTNATDPKTATFTMPDGDATITVKFIKGYTATLEMTDVSGVTATSTASIRADGKTVTGTSTNGSITYDGGIQSIHELSDGVTVEYDAPPAAKVVKTTANTGTTSLSAPSGSFPIVGEDVTVGVLLMDSSNPLLARVELKGKSDIVGNGDGVEIADATPGTSQGKIWTTTKDGNTVTVTLTVAEGYVAVVTAKKDSPSGDPIATLAKGAIPGSETKLTFSFTTGSGPLGAYISDPQTLSFTMPGEDVVVTVEYLPAGGIPKPHDPERDADPSRSLSKGYIYGVNRGDYAVINVPTLIDMEDMLWDADQYDGDTVTFEFAIKTGSGYTVLEGTDIELAPDPYDYYTHDIGGTKYTGARFTLAPKAGGTNTEAIRKILDNDGSIKDGETILYVRARTAQGESDYVQVLIKPYQTLKGTFASYAPTHAATVSLYALRDGATDSMDPDSYEIDALLTETVVEETGSGQWVQEFTFKSSELDGIFMLVIEKTSHITYTRVNIALSPTAAGQTFEIEDEIFLIPGDVTGNGKINLSDRDMVSDYLEGACVGAWSKATDPDADPAAWAISTYNPESEAYRIDIDGDGKITFHDRDIVEDYMGWSKKSYLVNGILPSGLALPPAAGGLSLLSAAPEEPSEPLSPPDEEAL